MIRFVVNAALLGIFLGTFLGFLNLNTSVAADWQVKVAAGKLDRSQTPCSVTVPAASGEAGTVLTLVAKDGTEIAAQLTDAPLLNGSKQKESRTLTFVLPELAAGEELVLTPKAGASTATGFEWTAEEGKTALLSYGDKPVLKYMHERVDNSSPERRAETYKVYHHVYDPAGEQLVTKGPGGLFPHHRGLFYGFNRISYDGKKADVWHNRRGESQTHEAFVSKETGPVVGRHTVQIDWNGQDDKPFAKETREMTVYRTAGGTLIEFASKLESLGSEIKLDGDPQHAGFQFRASQRVPDETKKLTYYVRPDGKGEPGQFRNWPGNKEHVNLAFNALSFVLGEDRFTCCYLDRPENPKEARFSERDYGRFGSYFAASVTPEKPLLLNYRIWLQEGEMSVEEVAAKSQDFVNPPIITLLK